MRHFTALCPFSTLWPPALPEPLQRPTSRILHSARGTGVAMTAQKRVAQKSRFEVKSALREMIIVCHRQENEPKRGCIIFTVSSCMPNLCKVTAPALGLHSHQVRRCDNLPQGCVAVWDCHFGARLCDEILTGSAYLWYMQES